MYAEVRCFDDNGDELNAKPYYIPVSDIVVNRTPLEDDGRDVVRYRFKFEMTRLEDWRGEKK